MLNRISVLRELTGGLGSTGKRGNDVHCGNWAALTSSIRLRSSTD